MRDGMKEILNRFPLARRMTIIVIFFSLLFVIVSTTVQVGLDYQKQLMALDQRLEQIRVIEAPVLSNSIWHFDEEQIKLQLQGMLNLQDIGYVELDVYGGKTYKAGRELNPDKVKIEELTLEYAQAGEVYEVGSLRVMADLSSLEKRVTSWLLSILLVSALQMFLLAAVILIVVERLLTHPLREIVQYAETLDLDHLDQPLHLKSRKLFAAGYELELVALKLNEMRLRLIENVSERISMENALRDSEQNYREIFNATSEAIIIREIKDGRVTQVNQSMLRMYEYDSESEVLGRLISELSTNEEPYTQEAANEKMKLALNEGPQIFEWRAKRKGGEGFWVEISIRCSVIAGENRLLAVIRDITERKQSEQLLLAQNEALIAQSIALEEAQSETKELNAELEHRVEERTIQLAALNQELEAFSYSVAHDLRAPLRHINGFSQVILDQYGSALNDEVIAWIKRIQDSSQNLYNMVDALLGLSRVSRDSMHIMTINLSDMVYKITDNLKKSDPDRLIDIVIEPGIAIQGDMRLIQSMMENLLQNAWKFTGNTDLPTIEFGTMDANGKNSENYRGKCYFIRDNGVGFDMTYIDRLFGPFQRLHSSVEFSGTGIGLATVKRIIQRHGGKVWAEADVEKGATFYFSLP